MDNAVLQTPSTRRTHKHARTRVEGDEGRIPSTVHRKESRGGLRGIFARNKSDKRPVSPVLEEPTLTPKGPIAQGSPSRKSTVQVPMDDDDYVSIVPAKPRSKPSRLDLGTRSAKKQSPLLEKPTPSPLSTAKSSASRTPTRASPSFDPLPYFQALPQAIKHAQLSASTMSADAILRLSSYKKPGEAQDEALQTATGKKDEYKTAAAKKSEKARNKHRRHVSGSISKAEWTQKLFVLTTSGTLLQYTVEGSFDRLPEKMLQLGKDSVAFASDAIPGKHWVLQISQRIEPDGTPAPDSRSLLSRLSFRNADYRRSATSLLLVLDSAEEMDAWIAIVRREIEALGGKKATSETGKPKVDNRVIQLSAQPSHRYLVKRDSSQTLRQSPQPSPTRYGPPSPLSVTARFEDGLRNKGSILSRPLSSARPSTGHRSVSNSTTSYDGQQLDSLRDGSNRLSYMSSGQMTLLTSEDSTPTASPTRESVSTVDDVSVQSMGEDNSQWKYNDRRQSMQPLRSLKPEMQPAQQGLRPHSIYGTPSRPLRSLSPATPNFSVPISSSKRYSTVKSTGVSSPPTQALPLPPIVRTQESVIEKRKGIKKPPPLSLSLTGPANSPVQQSRPMLVFTPTESSFKIVPKVKASVVDIPRSPLSPRSPTLLGEANQQAPRRVSSLMPLKDADQAKNRQQPQRHASLETIRDIDINLDKAPLRPAPLPPVLSSSVATHSSVRREIGQTESMAVCENIPSKSLQEDQRFGQVARTYKRPMSLDIERSFHRNQSLPNEPVRPRSSRSGSPPSGSSSQSWSFKDQNTAKAKHSATASAASLSSLSRTPSQRLKLYDHRMSVPSLSGPPLAPPPECALPPLPENSGVKSHLGPRHFVSVS